MSETVFYLLDYWVYFRSKRPDGTIEEFMDYLVEQRKIGGGL